MPKSQEGRKGHRGTTLTKKDVEEKLKTGKYSHKITTTGKGYGEYMVKYVLDFEVIPVINEIRIYEDADGEFDIPAEYRSDVIYGSFLNSMAVDLYTEEAGTEWAPEISAFLCGINDERKKHILDGTFFTDEEISIHEKRYEEILSGGRQQNKTTKGKTVKQAEKTLLGRLEKYKENQLLFMHDFSVPFENNMSERELRKCKNRQKISGGFRKYSVNEMYCRIMSVVETYKRKGMMVMENIQKVFEGTPVFNCVPYKCAFMAE